MTTVKRHCRLLCSLYSPAESTEPDKYMAEVPSFPNCMAWGDTPEETVAALESVVAATILTYQERKYDLPSGLTSLETDVAHSSELGILEISV